MTTVREEASRVEEFARQAFDSVWNDDLRIEIGEVADLLHTISREGVKSAEEMRLITDGFDLYTEGRTHRVKDREAKKAILEGMRRIEELASQQ